VDALSVATLVGGVLLDAALGEPRRFHPLVGFGNLTRALERRLYAPSRRRGALGVALLIVPFVGLAIALRQQATASRIAIDVLLLYFALGHRSLHEHARPVAAALARGDRAAAQAFAARMVSRDSAAIEPAPAATESVLENGNDGVFGALFWFCVAGGPGALLFRLANTLDAMWGYRNARYARFGWAAARFDDLLNWPSARLTALTYALLGRTRQALRCWREQAPAWDSPNAGPVMAAGAGALGLRLGGPARYEGQWHDRPPLGSGCAADAASIESALRLVRHGVVLWIVVILVAHLAGSASHVVF
jgi:adenosylcobinamide-phosphate synthase